MFDNYMYTIIIVQGNHECKCNGKRKHIRELIVAIQTNPS